MSSANQVILSGTVGDTNLTGCVLDYMTRNKLGTAVVNGTLQCCARFHYCEGA